MALPRERELSGAARAEGLAWRWDEERGGGMGAFAVGTAAEARAGESWADVVGVVGDAALLGRRFLAEAGEGAATGDCWG